MASTDHLTDEEFVTILKAETQAHYWRLFNLGVGGRFPAFLEWCGVMGEHLNITSDLLKQGLPASEMNRHTGDTPSIAGYRPDRTSTRLTSSHSCASRLPFYA